MKYILLMHSTKAGVDTYRAWSENDVRTHFAVLTNIANELRESGELVATEGLCTPEDAKIVVAGHEGMPVTDGIFPESKEFLLGYWMVDVDTPERAYEIAARISGAPGPGGIPTRMPMEVRQVMTRLSSELP